jgi:hypothetical protein
VCLRFPVASLAFSAEGAKHTSPGLRLWRNMDIMDTMDNMDDNTCPPAVHTVHKQLTETTIING